MTTMENLITELAKEHEEMLDRMLDRMIEEVKHTLEFAKDCKDNNILSLELKFRDKAEAEIKILNIATKEYYFIGNDYELNKVDSDYKLHVNI